MEKEFKQKGIAKFAGLTISPKKVVNLKFKLRYDEVITSVNLLQGLNADITIHAKAPDRKAVNLGMFKVGGINFDKDGNSTIPFTAMVEQVNLENICSIVDEEDIILKFMAVLELPENETEESGESEWED